MPLFRQERCAPWAPIRCRADFISCERQHRLAQHDKMFDRRNKEINTLKCKVDKLNKDYAVLTKNNDQLCGLSNGLRDVLKKYITKEKKAIEANMLWLSVADIVLKLMCVSCCYIYSRQIFHHNKE